MKKMKKNILKVTIVAAFALMAGINVYNAQNPGTMSDLALANVEALAVPEQPNTSDCKYDPNSACEALHPTDPSQDKYRDRARW